MNKDLYREQILDHYRQPRHFGSLVGAQLVVEETNASCGDEIKLFLKKEGGKFYFSFTGQGCAISQAATSLLLEKIQGWSRSQLDQIDEKFVFSLLGGPVNPGRVRCALLPWRALRKALARLEDK